MLQVTLPEAEMEDGGQLSDFAAAEYCDDMLEHIDDQLKEFGLEIVECVSVGDTNFWFKIEKIGSNTMERHTIFTEASAH